MGLWITLRKNNEHSFFQENLLRIISNQDELDGNRLILASGYFSEDPRPKYSILDDHLLPAIRDNGNITKIDVIGTKGSLQTFNRFCSKLETESGKPVTKRKPSSSNWHAKIAMKLKSTTAGELPVCAIIGSSNLTRPAYGINPPPEGVNTGVNFNYECDVLIFLNDGFFNILHEKGPAAVFPGIDNQEFGSIFYKKLPRGTTELEQLKGLWKEIEESTHIVK